MPFLLCTTPDRPPRKIDFRQYTLAISLCQAYKLLYRHSYLSSYVSVLPRWTPRLPRPASAPCPRQVRATIPATVADIYWAHRDLLDDPRLRQWLEADSGPAS